VEKRNYYKEASKEVLNIIFISMAIIIAVAGFYQMALLFLIVELMFILILPNTSFYKKYVDFKALSINNQRKLFNKSDKKLFNLPLSIKEKCQNLEKKYNQIVEKVSTDQDLGFAYQEQITKLEFLLDKYISLSKTFNDYNDYLKDNDYNSVLKDIEDTKHKIKHNYDSIKGTNDLNAMHKKMENKTIMKSNLEVLEKRLYKLKEIKSMIETLDVQINNIEDSFYLASDYIIFSNDSNVNVDVNKIIREIESTESTIKSTQNEMNKLKNVKYDYN